MKIHAVSAATLSLISARLHAEIDFRMREGEGRAPRSQEWSVALAGDQDDGLEATFDDAPAVLEVALAGDGFIRWDLVWER